MRKPGRNRLHEKGFQSRFLIGFEVLYCVLSSLHIVPKVELDKTNILFLQFIFHGTLLEQRQSTKLQPQLRLYVALPQNTCLAYARLWVSPNSETEIRKFRSRESDKESIGRVCAFLLLYLESLFVGVSMLHMCAVFMKSERAWIP